MSARRIVFYMHDLSGGGVERMRLTLIAELRTRGMDVRLVVNCKSGSLVSLLPPDLPLEELGTPRMLAAVLPLARYLRRTRPHVLIASLNHNNITALLAGMVACVGTAVVICQHNALSAERTIGWRYRVVPCLYWALQTRARAIVTVSHALAADFAAVAGIPRHRITPIYNPVIDAQFDTRASGPAPHHWLNDRNCPVFVFAGRLTAQKDPATLISAMALLLRSHPARLILLGEGPLRASLQTQAHSLGVADRIDFVGFQQNPLPWIKHADALISTSRYEGLGNTIVEALGCGTAVIATDCPHGPSEILLGGRIGSLVANADSGGLARAMQMQIDFPRDVADLRQRAADFTASACADAHMALIEKLFERPTVHALGLRLSQLRADQILEQIIADPVEDGVRLIVTPNIDHVRLLRNTAFAAAYDAAHLVCPDGFPILLYARLRGLGLRARVTGCELYHRLANHPSISRHRVCVVVESEQTRNALVAWGKDAHRWSGMTVLVAPIGLAGAPAAQMKLATDIRQTTPTILIMTLGAPLSEIFVHAHRATLGSCWALCVGQAVRVELGLTARAPAMWRLAGLEWLWRIRQEPRRLAGRYLAALAWFPIAVLRDVSGVRGPLDPALQRCGHPGLG